MVKHAQTICQLLPANCLRVLGYFVGLAFKGLNENNSTLAIGFLFFLKKISLVLSWWYNLLLLSMMCVFKDTVSNHAKSIIFWALFLTVLMIKLLSWIYVRLISLR